MDGVIAFGILGPDADGAENSRMTDCLGLASLEGSNWRNERSLSWSITWDASGSLMGGAGVVSPQDNEASRVRSRRRVRRSRYWAPRVAGEWTVGEGIWGG